MLLIFFILYFFFSLSLMPPLVSMMSNSVVVVIVLVLVPRAGHSRMAKVFSTAETYFWSCSSIVKLAIVRPVESESETIFGRLEDDEGDKKVQVLLVSH